MRTKFIVFLHINIVLNDINNVLTYILKNTVLSLTLIISSFRLCLSELTG